MKSARKPVARNLELAVSVGRGHSTQPVFTYGTTNPPSGTRRNAASGPAVTNAFNQLFRMRRQRCAESNEPLIWRLLEDRFDPRAGFYERRRNRQQQRPAPRHHNAAPADGQSAFHHRLQSTGAYHALQR